MRTLKTLTLSSLILSSFSLASLQASSLVCPSSNAPGQKIIAAPGAAYLFCAEDISIASGTSDKDYNDLIGYGTVSADGKHSTLVWAASDAGLNNTLSYLGVDLFSNQIHTGAVTITTNPWQEILLQDHAGGNIWSTGTVQFIVAEWNYDPANMPTGTPEPGTLGYAGIGLGLVGVSIAKRKVCRG